MPYLPNRSAKEQMTEVEFLIESGLGLQEEGQALTTEKAMLEASQTKDSYTSCPSLMSLPAEIRRQIYGWLHLMHPVQHAQLAPWYPTPIYSAYFLRAVMPELKGCDEETSYGLSEGGKTKPIVSTGFRPQGPRLLSPNRPLAGLPSAFLRASREIYEEARTFPFCENEFIFVNWFSSGIWAASAFTKRLSPWQRDAVRYARLEILAKDLTCAAVKEWSSLCASWSTGLRGLRLKILFSATAFGPAATNPESAGAEREALDLLVDGSVTAWVTEGLRGMKALRSLEVELANSGWGKERQLEWGRVLGELLNAGREEEMRVGVVSVERDVEDVDVGAVTAGAKLT